MTEEVTNGPDNQDEIKKKELEEFRVHIEGQLKKLIGLIQDKSTSDRSTEFATNFINKALQKATKEKEKSERQNAIKYVKDNIKKFNISSEELKGVLFTKKEIKEKADWLKEAALGNKKTRIVREWEKKKKEVSDIHKKQLKELNDSSTEKASA